MPFYFYQTPGWLARCFPERVWRIKTSLPELYVTFDDGPHPSITPFVLDTLARYNAKASFFCIGSHVARNPSLYQRIISEGHQVGNHTHHHLNGWKTANQQYLADVTEATRFIDSHLFRPPYGRLRSSQAREVRALLPGEGRIVMWDLLSGDFDTRLSGQDCFAICKERLRPGSIIVMHDSEKAWPRLSIALPLLLEYALSKGYCFKAM
ncbi:MAG: polysaccharide deacetylase family protein [Sphingomonadales bacterium]